MNNPVDRYAVFGYPISHSLSPAIHQLFAQQTQQKLSYEKIAVKPEEFSEAIQQFRTAGGKGLNITAPLKKLAYEIVDVHSPYARSAQAVNTIQFTQDKIIGHNTDGIGLVRDLTINLNISLLNKKILIVGAGGAAWGITGALLNEKPQLLHIANRTFQNAEILANVFSTQGTIDFSDLVNLPHSIFDVIINTSSSTASFENVANYIIDKNTVCYDVNYASGNSFLSWAKNQNALHCIRGLGMLVEQAAASFHIWRGVFPETQAVLQEIRAAL